MNKSKYLIVILLVILTPIALDACPMCQGGATKDTASAYKAVTAFLALLPMVMAFSIYYWIKKKAKENTDKDAI